MPRKTAPLPAVIVTIGDDGEFRLHEGLVERSAIHAGDTGCDETLGFVARPDDEISGPSPDRRADHPQGMRLQPAAGRRSQGAPIADHPRPSRGGFRCRLRFGALCAVRRSVRAVRLPLASARFAGDRDPTAQFIERSRRHPGRSPARSPGARRSISTGSNCRRRKASRRSRHCRPRPSSGSSPGASPSASSRSWRSRTGPIRSSKAAGRRLAIPFADFWRPTAANYWGRVKKAHGLAIGREILGDRWARDHAGDKKPELAAALETAFDPAKSTACIGLDRAAREAAAAWLPPGMAYAGAVEGDSADPQCDEAAPLTGDPDDAEPAEIDLAAAELPAFLTEDEPVGTALNGASAP